MQPPPHCSALPIACTRLVAYMKGGNARVRAMACESLFNAATTSPAKAKLLASSPGLVSTLVHMLREVRGWGAGGAKRIVMQSAHA